MTTSYIDEAAHHLMRYHPIDGMHGAVRVGDAVIKPHGDRVFSVYRADSGMVVLMTADSPHQAYARMKGVFDGDKSEL